MLDMGFIPDIEEICTKLPAQRQTLLFSATMPPVIKKLADKFLSNPKSIEVARPATAGANIAQFLVPVEERKKRDVLRDLLRSEGVESAIIFCNRKTMVRELNQSLKRPGLRSGEIHGDIDQASRIAELDRFKSGEINLLVASDVACARPRRQGRQPRLQFRRALASRRLCPPHRPHRPRRARPAGPSPSSPRTTRKPSPISRS